MTNSKFLQKITTHLVALMLGGLIVFGGMQMLSENPQVSSALADEANQKTNLTVAKNIPINSQESFVAAAVAQTGPAVVRIDTQKTIPGQTVDPFYNSDPFFRDFFGGQFRFQVPPKTLKGIGSGFITDPSGIILTNAHVVDQADEVKVTLKDGRVFQGEVRGVDKITDLAVVKINTRGEELPVATLGDSSQLQVGDWAIAVGNPVGLDNTVTLGIISTLDRSSAQAGIPDKRIDFLQTDAAINPGNSGGPLLNAKGEVIGINTAIRTDAMGIGFAIPIDKAKSLQEILAAGKSAPHPYVGIQMVNLTPELARQENQDPNSSFFLPEIEGVLVVGVLPNTPAARGGMRRGDVIFQVNNQRVTQGSEIQKIVEKVGVGQDLRFKIRRGDRNLELTVTTAQLETSS